jgi:outer membrane protein OmpA-like peptidoglycan-associated protein
MNRRARTLDLGSSATGIRRWILPALLLSLLIHAGFVMWSNKVDLNLLNGVEYDRSPPRRFQLESVELDPRLMNPAPAEVKRPAAAPLAVKLPDENVALEKAGGNTPMLPPAPKLDSAILSETPQLIMPSLQNSLSTVKSQEVGFPESKELDNELLSEKPTVAGTSSLELPAPESRSGAREAGGTSGERGFSNLDDLLAQTGPLTPETAPILMPTDLLFDYDAPVLRPEALASLRKLGLLIQRNPGARFLIEGHTDSFGSDEYNINLSRKRAESVKAWLTGNMGLPENIIQTVGCGKTRLIAPADGTIAQQQINRRVEIIIRSATP